MTPLAALGYLFSVAKTAPTGSLKDDETLCEAFLAVAAAMRRLSGLDDAAANAAVSSEPTEPTAA